VIWAIVIPRAGKIPPFLSKVVLPRTYNTTSYIERHTHVDVTQHTRMHVNIYESRGLGHPTFIDYYLSNLAPGNADRHRVLHTLGRMINYCLIHTDQYLAITFGAHRLILHSLG
jgi:hypothetical protein